jgi:RNA 3'-terminal phosphate cyclase (ATP)
MKIAEIVIIIHTIDPQVLTDFLGRQSAIPIAVEAFKESEAHGNGSSVSIVAETTTGCLLGAGRIGSRGKTGAELGADAAEELVEDLKLRACVDRHLQDQVSLS